MVGYLLIVSKRLSILATADEAKPEKAENPTKVTRILPMIPVIFETCLPISFILSIDSASSKLVMGVKNMEGLLARISGNLLSLFSSGVNWLFGSIVPFKSVLSLVQLTSRASFWPYWWTLYLKSMFGLSSFPDILSSNLS